MNSRIRSALQKSLEYHTAVASEKAASAGLSLEDLEPGKEMVPSDEEGRSRRSRRSVRGEENQSEEMSHNEAVARMHHEAARDLRDLLAAESGEPAIVAERQTRQSKREPSITDIRQVRAGRH